MKNKGFTIIEMMVVVAIFTLLVSASAGLFVSSLRSQRQSLATQEVLDQTSYLIEYMGRALRLAKKDDDAGTCTLPGTPKLNYYFDDVNQCINFRDYNDECQQFCLIEGQLKDIAGNELTSSTLQVDSFRVELTGQQQPPLDNLQPRLTIFLEITGQEQSGIKIQTTVSQRNPDVRQ